MLSLLSLLSLLSTLAREHDHTNEQREAAISLKKMFRNSFIRGYQSNIYVFFAIFLK